MSRHRDDGWVPELVLERFRLGELPEAEAERLRERLRSDAALRGRLEALDASDREIRRLHPPGWLANAARSRVAARSGARSRGPRRHPWLAPAALAAAATLAAVALPRVLEPPEGRPGAAHGGVEADPSVRTKGLRPHLALFRRMPDGSESLADGAVASPGDVIRVGYRAAGERYGAIVSLDGRGAVTRHLPLAGDEAVPLKSGGTVLLDQAYELDDAPRFERFYFVTSAQPFPLLPVLQAVRDSAGEADAAPSLPPGLAQDSFLLLKGIPR